MELLAQRIVDGLGNGCIYAALALALVLVFRSTGVVNFAQGELAMLSTFLVWLLVDAGAGIWLALIVAAVVAFVAGAVLERGVIRYVPRDDHLTMVIVMIGMYTLLNAAGLYFFGSDGRQLPSLFGAGHLKLGSITLPYTTFGALVTLIGVAIGLWLLFRFTRLGLGLRAVAENAESSALAGLPTSRLLAIGWGLAASLGAVAGVLVTSLGLFLEPSMMLPVLVYALAAATLGGFDSPVGATVAGIILGVAESLVTGYITAIGPELTLMVPVVVMVIVMLIRPNGLFGAAKVVRA